MIIHRLRDRCHQTSLHYESGDRRCACMKSDQSHAVRNTGNSQTMDVVYGLDQERW